ncbi:hypothetical protein Z945_2173 [Sulfitobacter noctilucae]|nr:hypothetical protein Z945_2173 [Sulfitobacter noctilucae]
MSAPINLNQVKKERNRASRKARAEKIARNLEAHKRET